MGGRPCRPRRRRASGPLRSLAETAALAKKLGAPLVQRGPLPLEPVRVIGVPVGPVPRAVAVLGAVRLAALVSFEPKNAARESVSLGVRSQQDCALPNRHCELVGRVTAR